MKLLFHFCNEARKKSIAVSKQKQRDKINCTEISIQLVNLNSAGWNEHTVLKVFKPYSYMKEVILPQSIGDMTQNKRFD